VADRVDGVGDQFAEQAPDLVERQRDQLLAAAVVVTFAGGDDGEDAWASMTSVVCRYQESQRRTCGSARPMVLPVWKQVSTFQRVPATVTRTRSGTGCGDQQR
jgi:hypothetical protein